MELSKEKYTKERLIDFITWNFENKYVMVEDLDCCSFMINNCLFKLYKHHFTCFDIKNSSRFNLTYKNIKSICLDKSLANKLALVIKTKPFDFTITIIEGLEIKFSDLD